MSPLKSNREARFRALYNDSYADVLRFVQRRAPHAHAEDVVAEAFLVVWRRFEDAPRGLGDQRAWLFGIARNCLLNASRGDRRRSALAVRLAETSPREGHGSSSNSDDLVAHRLDVAAAWQRLSAAQQEVLALTVFEHLPARQAARALDITPTAYRLRLLRARRALRQQLEPSEPAALRSQETTA